MKCGHGHENPAQTGGTFLHQLSQQSTPLAAENVGPSKAAISTAHTQVGDAPLHQVEGCRQPPLTGGECLAASTANHCTTLRTQRHDTVMSQNRTK